MKGKIRMIFSRILTAVVVFVTRAAVASAQTGGGGGSSINIPDPLGGATFDKVATSIINTLATVIAPPLAAIMVLIGALQIMTAGGDESKISAGRKTLLYTAIGFGIVVAGNLILQLIRETLGAP
jgi:hypothetical protein